MTDKRGNAIIELALVAGFISMFLVFLITIGRLTTLRPRLLNLARLGADLEATNVVDTSVVESMVNRRLARLKTHRLNPVFTSGRFTESASSRFYTLVFGRVRCDDLTETVVVLKERTHDHDNDF